jgi:hypothetical protein
MNKILWTRKKHQRRLNNNQSINEINQIKTQLNLIDLKIVNFGGRLILKLSIIYVLVFGFANTYFFFFLLLKMYDFYKFKNLQKNNEITK